MYNPECASSIIKIGVFSSCHIKWSWTWDNAQIENFSKTCKKLSFRVGCGAEGQNDAGTLAKSSMYMRQFRFDNYQQSSGELDLARS